LHNDAYMQIKMPKEPRSNLDSEPCCELRIRLTPSLFKALCDPTRLELLTQLADRDQPCTVSEMGECCPVDLSVVSRHLAVLRDAGLLRAERCGREVRYELCCDDVVSELRGLADALEACCPPKPSPCECDGKQQENTQENKS